MVKVAEAKQRSVGQYDEQTYVGSHSSRQGEQLTSKGSDDDGGARVVLGGGWLTTLPS